MQNNKLEMITVVNQYGQVVSVEFLRREHGGDKITIIRTNEEEQLPPRSNMADECRAK